ncbi:MAG: hypothetical protein CVT49_09290 [candidate division Zixibacteria bacterium HGW-Zixibacteria-1]|nr:MAG: hypothetical protein CVT49_09290 [candidate division Zixibacteria bacterium HGW-Zixibacteria-1]
MKRLVIALLAVGLVFNIALAKKKDKAGRLENGVYIDDSYNFSLPISEDVWNISIKKDKSPIRLILTKKVFDVPIVYTQDPGYTKTPKVTVYVDTTSWSAQLFVDSLLNDQFKSKQKKEILQNCEILYGDYKPKRKSKYQFGDVPGVLISGELQYTKQIPDVITDYYGGAIFFAKQDNNLYIFHLISENKYFSTEYEDFVTLLNGLKFGDGKVEKE